MAGRGRGARNKGFAFERKIAKLLTEATDVEYKRGLGQTRAGASENPDVYSEHDGRWHFECKRHIRTNIKAAMRQAVEDIKEASAERVPVVVTKDDYGPILVTMNWDDWIEMFKEYQSED